jgi:hypothetical protein
MPNTSETKLNYSLHFCKVPPQIDTLAISEHGLKEEEITQCALVGYTVATHFCRKEYKGGGIAIYSS